MSDIHSMIFLRISARKLENIFPSNLHSWHQQNKRAIYFTSVLDGFKLIHDVMDICKTDQRLRGRVFIGQNVFELPKVMIVVALREQYDKILMKLCEIRNAKHITCLFTLSSMEYINPLTQNDINAGLIGACKGGHIAIAQWMIDLGANDFNLGLVQACTCGHIEIATYMMNLGANNINGGFHAACMSGHLHIAQLMISLGANNLQDSIKAAANHNHRHVVNYLLNFRVVK